MPKTHNINREVFESWPIPKALTELALPMIFGQLIILVYNLADTFFIGRTNNPLMVAGVSLLLPVFNISITFANLFGIGGGTLISRLMGAKREDEAKTVSSFCFYMTIISAGIFALSMFVFMESVLRLLGASNDTMPFAKQYTFCVIVIGAVPTILSMTLSNFLRSTGCAKQAGFGVSMGGIINMGLDPLFMFVLLPKGYEVLGAGIATMLSNVIICSYFLIVILRMKGNNILSLSVRNIIPSRQNAYSIFAVGIPAAISVTLFDITYIIIDKLASGYGDIPLAAVGIVLKAERLPLNVGIGLCQGMMPLAAYNYSARNFARMREAVNFSRLVGLVIGFAAVALYEIFAPQIMRIFIEDAQTVELGTHFLRARVLATPFMFMCFHLVNFFQAVGHGGKALALGTERWVVFNIPLLFIMNYVFGMYGIVWTQVVADIMMTAVSVIVYWRFERSIHEETA
ncbi:MAG: MATE family efflux transporter [Synergistaceae bacterium]|nr:MATE family efflux transporter [Synergistaceae bacterium]